MSRTQQSTTVRFTEVVKRSGEPHVHTLWLAPEKDRELQRARKEHRIMTVRAGVSGKADTAVVGFAPDRSNAALNQYLIFPKSLRRFDGDRVIGIKFALVAQPELASAATLKNAAATSPRRARSKRSPTSAPASNHLETTAPTAKPPERVPARSPVKTSHPSLRTSSPKAPPGKSRRSSPAHRAVRAAESSGPPTAPTASSSRFPLAPAVQREIRAAIRDLERGKSVAAHQRLQRIIQRANA